MRIFRSGSRVVTPEKIRPGHGATGLIWPAQDRPDLVFRFLLSGKVGDIRRARGMQQDRLARLGRDLENREEPRLIEAGAVDVGVKLESVRVAVDENSLGFLRRSVGRVH